MGLREVLRNAILAIDNVGPSEVGPHVERVREALGELGLGANCHLGDKEMSEGDNKCVEWYAGQLLSISDNNEWFAMNSLINCLDRFCPEKEGSK